jgi:MFS family permease
MMMLNVAAFLPTFIEGNDWISDDGYELDSSGVSLILSIFAVAQIIFAPFNAMIKNKIGTKNAIICGFFMLTGTTFGLGAISRISDPHLFKYIAIVLRFFQGQGDVLL